MSDSPFSITASFKITAVVTPVKKIKVKITQEKVNNLQQKSYLDRLLSLWQIDCEINSLDSIHDTSREQKKERKKERKRNQRLATELSTPGRECYRKKRDIKKKQAKLTQNEPKKVSRYS